MSTLFLIALFTATEINAQKDDSLYRVNVELGLGPSYYFTDIPYDDIKNIAPVSVSLRLMWKPEHKLSMGVETGFIPLYYLKTKFYDTVYGSTDAKLAMRSVPIMAVFAMTIVENFRIFGGVGGFILFSNTESFDNVVDEISWSNAYELGASYLYPLNDRLKLGGEVKTFYIVRVDNYDLSINFAIKYALFTY